MWKDHKMIVSALGVKEKNRVKKFGRVNCEFVLLVRKSQGKKRKKEKTRRDSLKVLEHRPLSDEKFQT
ncbi:hypothetical protein ACH5RR_023018 [Cinchona calisaya]|uniref:Uncharacterized protein n=1 Tax=Cinchona calisaya TaxID=153742 RepID=A0ABD2ZBB8_9GENT